MSAHGRRLRSAIIARVLSVAYSAVFLSAALYKLWDPISWWRHSRPEWSAWAAGIYLGLPWLELAIAMLVWHRGMRVAAALCGMAVACGGIWLHARAAQVDYGGCGCVPFLTDRPGAMLAVSAAIICVGAAQIACWARERPVPDAAPLQGPG